MTVVEAIEMVLSQSQEGMTIQEIYQQICAQDLYQFKAKNPSNIVRSALRRHCLGLDFPTSSSTKHFQIVRAKRGKTTYKRMDGSKPAARRMVPKPGREKLPEAVKHSAYADHWENEKVHYDADLFDE